ncbi:hypothetical protein SDC9_15156 [bioreactor metagenome]|uniref:DUF2508 domain-containing protein n=1 Tax=bioreactor metagenome TaxID=1076179 RepID=A0A644TR55_9ZZZZ|nr:YaaL family protein [Negativicutes bacterium]
MYFAGLDRVFGEGFGEKSPIGSLPTLPEVVEQAKQEWHYAQHLYNQVTDDDLIEYAIYLMKASEKKYIYLLKRARREGVTYTRYR